MKNGIQSTTITPDLILSDTWCDPMFEFMKETGLGLKSDLYWESNNTYLQAHTSDQESCESDFSIGEFE